jgi:hypothetical protein
MNNISKRRRKIAPPHTEETGVEMVEDLDEEVLVELEGARIERDEAVHHLQELQEDGRLLVGGLAAVEHAWHVRLR